MPIPEETIDLVEDIFMQGDMRYKNKILVS